MSDELYNAPGELEATPAPAELTLDDLFSSEINQENVNKVAKEMGLKSGTYTTTPPFTPTILIDAKNDNRRVVKFWGSVQLGDVTGKAGYRISPDLRNSKDRETGADSGKPDSASKLYVMAVKAYEVAYGRKPSNDKEVVEYLRDFSHKVRVWQTEDGDSRVVSISAIRQPSTQA